MDRDIEWLFKEWYEVKKDKPNEEISFISNWDALGEDVYDFKILINEVYDQASKDSSKYNYSYEQFSLKEQIINFANEQYSLKILEQEITITPSSTTSIFMTTLALSELGVKRVLVITPTYFSTLESMKRGKNEVFYYHLKDSGNLIINFIELESILKEQYIDCIFLTDPIYSSGIEFTLIDY